MKILIANRGEIAVRIVRACRELRLPTVAVYSDCDRLAPHVRLADEAVALDGNASDETYLRADKILDAARRTGADAVHPGYGFLAENADFARAVTDAGLRFIGPPAEAIALMGGKTASREVAVGAGVAVVPGSDGVLPDGLDDAELERVARDVGFPVFVKAVAGGGGKGMRLVREPAALPSAVRAARSEAASAFGNGDVYLERAIEQARHVEMQVLADAHGAVVAFVERECSIQRRHQKLFEESPSVAVDRELRHALAEAAVSLTRAVGYENAGTIEFLLDRSGRFYFLEMNTRLQVEHPVTEMVTGVDLVQWQLRIAQGERLSVDAESMLEPRGHAIECRVYAEDPDAGFLPCPGVVTYLETPAGPGVRDDGGVAAGFEVPVFYDSMISKLITWGEDRIQAMDRMLRALGEYEIGGVKTTIPLFCALLIREDVREGRFDTGYLDRLLASGEVGGGGEAPAALEEVAVMATALAAVLGGPGQMPRAPAARAASGWRRAARLEGLR